MYTFLTFLSFKLSSYSRYASSRLPYRCIMMILIKLVMMINLISHRKKVLILTRCVYYIILPNTSLHAARLFNRSLVNASISLCSVRIEASIFWESGRRWNIMSFLNAMLRDSMLRSVRHSSLISLWHVLKAKSAWDSKALASSYRPRYISHHKYHMIT